MVLIRAIVRPEKVGTIQFELIAAGFPAITKVDISGRGKQKGIKVGSVSYDEIPKVMLMIAAEEKEKDLIISIILRYARTGGTGMFGDGRIFVSQIIEAYVIREGR